MDCHLEGCEFIKTQLCLKIFLLRVLNYYVRPRQTCTRVGTLIVATIYLQLIQNRYMF